MRPNPTRQRQATHTARKAKGRSRHLAAHLQPSGRRLQNSLRRRVGKSVYWPALLTSVIADEKRRRTAIRPALLSARRS